MEEGNTAVMGGGNTDIGTTAPAETTAETSSAEVTQPATESVDASEKTENL